MALSWAYIPWLNAFRLRLRIDLLGAGSRQWMMPPSKSHFSLSSSLQDDPPSLQALRLHPYPARGPDTSVFEEQDEEYASASVSTPAHTGSVAKWLKGLVLAKDWAKAETVRAELVDAGINIPLSRVYEYAALHVLEDSDMENRAQAFANWFSLCPKSKRHPPYRTFQGIRSLLFYSDRPPDVKTAMQFGMIAAAKGYLIRGRRPGRFDDVIGTVFRYSPPSVSWAYMEALIKQITAVQGSFMPDGSGRRTGRSTVWRMYEVAIRTHLSSRRIDEAIRLLKVAEDRGYRISISTIKTTLSKLDRWSDKYPDIFEKYGYLLQVEPVDPFAFDGKLSHPAVKHRAITGPEAISTLASTLKTLRKSIFTGTNLPTAMLLDFLSLAVQEGRLSAVKRLRRKVFTKPVSVQQRWLFIELLHYHQRREWLSVVITFTHTLEVVGVRHDIIQSHLFDAARYSDPNIDPKDVTPHFMELSPIYPTVMPKKAWPTPSHTGLVWSALVGLSKGLTALDALYQELLNQAQRVNPMTVATSEHEPSFSIQQEHDTNGDDRCSAPTLPGDLLYPFLSERVEEGHFAPFIDVFGVRGGPLRAAQVLADMRMFGLPVTVYHWTRLAMVLARTGNTEKALDILSHMEDSLESGEKEDTRRFPPPSVETYMSLLGIFVYLTKDIQTATEIENRLFTKLDYKYGSNPRMDGALRKLHKMKQQHAKIPFRLLKRIRIDRRVLPYTAPVAM